MSFGKLELGNANFKMPENELDELGEMIYEILELG